MSLLSGRQEWAGHSALSLHMLGHSWLRSYISIHSVSVVWCSVAEGLVAREEEPRTLSWVLFAPSVAKLGELTLLCCLRNLDFKTNCLPGPIPADTAEIPRRICSSQRFLIFIKLYNHRCFLWTLKVFQLFMLLFDCPAPPPVQTHIFFQ